MVFAMNRASAVLSVVELRKLYGDAVAVDGVSFAVAPNEIVGLLGPNGAGKTTTINMILGVLQPSSGTIRIEDIDLAADRSAALCRTNFAAVYAPLPGNLTVEQNLRVFGLMYSVKNLSERIETLLRYFELEPFRKAKYGSALVRRADPGFFGQGDAKSAPPFASRRTHGVAGPPLHGDAPAENPGVYGQR